MGFSLFGNYNKPGPGVSKDEPPKPPLVRFWVIFFRKWTNFIKLNLLFMVPLSIAVALFFLINHFTGQPWICFSPVILLYPFIAGLTYVTRNYAREEHAFVFSDFKDAIKNNWKYFFLNGVICYLFYIVLSVSVNFYYPMLEQGWWAYIPFGICIAISVLFIFAQYYIPVMIVTFDLKFKQIYKNAFIFAIVGLWRNILLTLIFGIIILLNVFIFLTIGALPPIVFLIDFLLIVLVAFSFCIYLINFAVYPLVEKLMIKPYYEKQHAAETPELQNEKDPQQSLTSDAENNDEEDEGPEYVFVNGKLVKRQYLNDESVFEDRT